MKSSTEIKADIQDLEDILEFIKPKIKELKNKQISVSPVFGIMNDIHGKLYNLERHFNYEYLIVTEDYSNNYKVCSITDTLKKAQEIVARETYGKDTKIVKVEV